MNKMSIHYSQEAKEAGWTDYPPANNKFNEREPMTNEEAIIDIPAAQERVDAILGTKPPIFPAATLQTPPTHPPAPPYGSTGRSTEPNPAPNRKPRSDKGVPKKPPADPDEITLKLTLAEARNAAIACGKFDCYGIAEHIQDQIIAQLQKRLDSLTKQK